MLINEKIKIKIKFDSNKSLEKKKIKNFHK